jgi:hypothetical protein
MQSMMTEKNLLVLERPEASHRVDKGEVEEVGYPGPAS